MTSLRREKKLLKLKNKVELMEKKQKKSFLSDGVNEREYLLIISTSVFFLFVAIGLILTLLGRKIDGMYLSLLDMVSPVVMMIVGSIFAVSGVEAFTNRKSTQVRVRNERTVEVPSSSYINVEEEIIEPEINPENESMK